MHSEAGMVSLFRFIQNYAQKRAKEKKRKLANARHNHVMPMKFPPDLSHELTLVQTLVGAIFRPRLWWDRGDRSFVK